MGLRRTRLFLGPCGPAGANLRPAFQYSPAAAPRFRTSDFSEKARPLVSKIQVAATNAGARAQGRLDPRLLALSASDAANGKTRYQTFEASVRAAIEPLTPILSQTHSSAALRIDFSPAYDRLDEVLEVPFHEKTADCFANYLRLGFRGPTPRTG
jgi:hypothetical protein